MIAPPRRPAVLALALAAATLAGCATTRPAAAIPVPDARAEACAAPREPAVPTFSSLPTEEAPGGALIVDVVVRGERAVPESMIREAIVSHPGGKIDDDVLAGDVERVMALGAFEDVRVSWAPKGSGVELVFDLAPRPLVGATFFAPGTEAPLPGQWVAPLPGDLYDPAAVSRALHLLLRHWAADGRLDARAEARARRVDDRGVDLCFELDPGAVWTLESFDPVGAVLLSADELREKMATREGTVNVPGKPFREDLLHDDILRMMALAYDRGLLEVNIGAPRVTRIPERHAIRVELPVSEGPVYRVGRITLTGRLAGSISAYAALLEQGPGDVFSREQWFESMDWLKAHHRALTGRDVEVVPSTEMHGDRATVDVELALRGG